jgi:hypothetical protein
MGADPIRSLPNTVIHTGSNDGGDRDRVFFKGTVSA